MSRSPAGAESSATVSDRRSAYRRSLAKLDQMLEDGESWSGNERNCAFLNLGSDQTADTRFATISAISGLNHLDDGRSYALVDWDQDGDMDLWSTNRTAPRLRMMRNDTNNENHFLALRLIGTSCARDAIGARVEVVLSADQASRPLVRTLRAGEGFLAQSTKWLHFGLGDTTSVDTIIVHWPGGRAQKVRGVEADQFFEITQGDSAARPIPSPLASDSRLSPEVVSAPASLDEAQIRLSSQLPLPRIPIQHFDGSTDDLDRYHGQAVWLNLWASWCVPCLKELQDATARATQLRAAGVNVVALSLDGFDQPGAEPTGIADARATIDRLKFPFDSGVATPETIRRLQFADRQIFGRQSEMVLPTSFLLTKTGQLAAIYRGPVTVDRVLADADHLRDSGPALLESALPFSGIWFDGRRRFAPLAIVADLLDHRAVDDAFDYVQANHSDLARQPGYVEVVGVLGTTLARQGQLQAALEMYRRALESDPSNLAVLNNMAWFLATCEDRAMRDPQRAVAHAETAAKISHHQSAAILDTLATSYAAAKRIERARATWEQAISLAQQQGQSEFAARLRSKRAKLDDH